MRPGGHSPFRQGPGQMGGNPFGMMNNRRISRSSPFGTGQNGSGFGPSAGKRGGGILSKLLNKGGSSNLSRGLTGFERAPQAAGGSAVQSLLKPGSLNGFLNNTQQVLKTAQQVGPMIQQYGPMIQQYGPMVKNLPAMWKLYRGLKDVDSDNETETKDSSKNSNEHHPENNSSEESNMKSESKKKKKKKTKRKSSSDDSTVEKIKNNKRSSTPKLYI
ncbi:Sec-independent protein translocase protein TatA [Bacillus pakistanensis]|uniref:Sec-independent protein translocase protein TatA n=1 Tax=Rossellomorea pakistanensis TaxID=992288 RepID=A0ABS2NA27_9BACI|nr:YqfQ family protein [Bacillus pakistanensis]MBM7584703.1 Sec-independent protein translocase protein TatA [Bacillus pakistanensis]